MTESRSTTPGHNGGPPLDEPVSTNPGRCKHCRHWRAPPDGQQRAYESFRLGLSRRRVKRPTGACDRVLLGTGRTPTFAGTTAEFGCGNFEALPSRPIPKGGGFITVWVNGRIAWQRAEDALPARYRQQDLSLSEPDES